jgi:HD-like signal output (HDOD) protein
MNATVLEMIKKSAAVPSMPQVVMRFLEVMQDPNFDYHDLAKVLSTDPGTVSEILRLCNSALFGVRRKIASLQQALTLLGPKRTRSLLLGRYLVDALAQKPAAGLDMAYFWRRSLSTAVATSRFAERKLPRLREESFFAALLSDIGIPILAEAMPDRFAVVAARFAPRKSPMTAEDERKAVGVAHADVSAMVLAHWTLPEIIHRAVNLHQSAQPGDGEVGDVARLIQAGDRLSRVLCDAPEPADAVAEASEAAAFVGVGPELLADLLPAIAQDVEELAGALRIDVLSGKICSQLARAIKEQLASTPA